MANGGGIFSDIAGIVQGLINSGNLDLAHDIQQAMLEQNRGIASNLDLPKLLQAAAEQVGKQVL